MERDGAGAAGGLGGLDAAVAMGAADVQDGGVAVDVAVLECDPFAAATGLRPGAAVAMGAADEDHQRPVARPDLGGEGVQLVP